MALRARKRAPDAATQPHRSRFTVKLLLSRRSSSPAPQPATVVPRAAASQPAGRLPLLHQRAGAAGTRAPRPASRHVPGRDPRVPVSSGGPRRPRPEAAARTAGGAGPPGRRRAANAALCFAGRRRRAGGAAGQLRSAAPMFRRRRRCERRRGAGGAGETRRGRGGPSCRGRSREQRVPRLREPPCFHSAGLPATGGAARGARAALTCGRGGAEVGSLRRPRRLTPRPVTPLR